MYIIVRVPAILRVYIICAIEYFLINFVSAWGSLLVASH